MMLLAEEIQLNLLHQYKSPNGSLKLDKLA